MSGHEIVLLKQWVTLQHSKIIFFERQDTNQLLILMQKNTAFHVTMIILSLCGFVILHLKCKLKNMT